MGLRSHSKSALDNARVPAILDPVSSLAAALIICSSGAWGKDLQGRVGVGFAAGLGETSSLTVRYGLPVGEAPSNVLLEVGAGASLTGGVDDQWSAGLRALYAIVAEDNLNLYAALGLAYVNFDGSHRFRLQPALSAEWFAFGLENLGISASWGLALDMGAGIDLTTFGGAPGVGLNYYF